MVESAIEIENYIEAISTDKREAFVNLRNVILKSLPLGFTEEMSYGMVGFVVPFSIYPSGYHCNSKLPLPFMSIAAQKNLINLYHMGIYADHTLLDWFQAEYPKHCKSKLDMGKSCIRFKKLDQIPYDLIGELCRKMDVEQWIATYETKFKR